MAQHRSGFCCISEEQRDAMKATDSVARREYRFRSRCPLASLRHVFSARGRSIMTYLIFVSGQSDGKLAEAVLGIDVHRVDNHIMACSESAGASGANSTKDGGLIAWHFIVRTLFFSNLVGRHDLCPFG
jgi:hypothetical protein